MFLCYFIQKNILLEYYLFYLEEYKTRWYICCFYDENGVSWEGKDQL